MRQSLIYLILVFFSFGLSQELNAQSSSALSQRIGMQGVALPIQQVNLRAKITGQIDTIEVREGSFVHQGDVIFRLHADEAEAKMKVAEIEAKSRGAIESAKAELEFATNYLARIKMLVQKSAANENEYQESKLQYERAKARLAIERERLATSVARYQLAKTELDNFIIRAPFDGYVHQLKAEVGQTIDKQDDIVELVSLKKLRVELFLPVAWVEKMPVGSQQKMEVAAPFQKSIDAKVLHQAKMIESTSRTLRFVFEVDNSQYDLPAGVIVSPIIGSKIQSASSLHRTGKVWATERRGRKSGNTN